MFGAMSNILGVLSSILGPCLVVGCSSLRGTLVRQRDAQRYAFPALCLAGVMPCRRYAILCAYIPKYALVRLFLHEICSI